MADKKSKIPSFEELGKYVGKLFTDIKSSVKEIVNDYQKDHPDEEKVAENKVEEETKETAKTKEAAKTKEETKKKTSEKKSTTKAASEEKDS